MTLSSRRPSGNGIELPATGHSHRISSLKTSLPTPSPSPPSPPQPADAPRRIVVALGGNAITRPDQEGSVAQDYENLQLSLDSVTRLIVAGHQVVITHGNGPQVGNQMIRVELARGQAPDLPLDVMVADLQGGLGYMIERVLRNKLLDAGLEQPVCALLSMVEVDPGDPAFELPTKFVGPSFKRSEVEGLVQRGWEVREDHGRGWRRVVPSPQPRGIVERDLIHILMDAGAVVIVTGGGGIPVARGPDGLLYGVEGVIDKDLAGAVLALELAADDFFVLTSVQRVMVRFGTPRQRPLGTVKVAEARAYLAAGHFPPGTMGPKIEAACRFIEGGGRRALITDIFTLTDALDGMTGTWIVP